MNPKNFKCPFTWKQRRPLIHDRVLFVPEYYDRHHEWKFPGWQSPEVFGRQAPIEIEYCTGNGAWIIDKALKNPDRDWVAVEVQFERVRKIWSKMRNENISNLLIVCGEALTFTRYYVPENSFSAAYVNFPDPWPKEKHAKKRLLQEPFITEMARGLIPGAAVTIVTDHPGYTAQVTHGMRANPLWSAVFEDPYYVTQWEDYGTSYFDQLWKEQGLQIHYLQFRKEAIQ
jgi:tRNA (guanine-N7-)-methyltransferase